MSHVDEKQTQYDCGGPTAEREGARPTHHIVSQKQAFPNHCSSRGLDVVTSQRTCASASRNRASEVSVSSFTSCPVVLSSIS